MPAQTDTQVRLGEDSLELGEDSLEGKPKTAKRFQSPTLEEVKAYCLERKNNIDPERFIDYYTSNGWSVGKNKMKDWKAAVRTWERNGYSNGDKSSQLVTINGKEYEYRNGKYYIPHGCGIAVDPYHKSDLDDLF